MTNTNTDTNRFGNRMAVDASTIGATATLRNADVGYSSKNGGGSANEEESPSRFAKRVETKELAKKLFTEVIPGIAPTYSEKGGAAAPSVFATIKHVGKELATETAQLSAIRAFDATLIGALGKLPSIKGKVSWFTKIPFIGKKIEKNFEEEQAKMLAHGIKIGGLFAAAIATDKVESDELAEKLMVVTDTFKQLVVLDGSAAIVSTLQDKAEAILESFDEVSESLSDVHIEKI